MGLYERERQLSFLYGAAACLSLTTVICVAVPWNHWKEILDTCVNLRCECILYGKQSFYSFDGGNSSLCYFTTLAPIPALFLAIGMAGYHGYRICMPRRKLPRGPFSAGDVMVVEPEIVEDRNPGTICWIALLILTFGIGVLLIVSSVILSDGFSQTCEEYRRGLSKNSQITGQMAAAFNVRLSCTSVFDFMDYLEPVTRPFQRKEYINYNYPHEEKDFQRGPFINTGLSLVLAMTSAWINCLIWIIIFVINAALAYKTGGCCSNSD